jgi:hypothetical protein
VDVAKICVKAEFVLNIELIMLDANAAGVSGASRRARPQTLVRGLEDSSLSDVLMKVQACRIVYSKCKLVVYQVPNLTVRYHYANMVRLWRAAALAKKCHLGVYDPARLPSPRAGFRV